MLVYLCYKILVIVYGMLYPAFCSYKAIKEKDVRAYVHWMMYWIVFALYTSLEYIADPLLSFWFPFYYELKIIFFVWLIYPSTRGASFVYRRILHPEFLRHEDEIECIIADFRKRTTDYLYKWGTQIFAFVTNNIWQAAYRVGSPPSGSISAPTAAYDLNDKRFVSTSADNSPTGVFDMNRFMMFNPVGLMRGAISYNEINSAAMVQGQGHREQYSSQDFDTSRIEEYEDSQPQGPTTRARGTRKKKEATNNLYGTLPRTRRTKKDT